MSEASLRGSQRAALVVLGLDQDIAADVLRHLSPDELRCLEKTIGSLGIIPIDAIEPTFEDFCRKMQEPLLPSAAGAYFRQLATSALGDRVNEVLAPPTPPPPPALEALRSAKANALAELLRDEHPQIAAVVLAQLPKIHAAKVMRELPELLRIDLVRRISLLKELPRRAAQEAVEALASGLSNDLSEEGFDGIAFAAGVLNEMPKNEAEIMLSEIEESEPELSPKIRQAMFTFEDLGRLTARSLQVLMRMVPTETMLVALKTASESLRDHFLSAVSARAAASMREDLVLLPPTRLSDVEKAQREVLEVATRLAAEGQLTLPGGGGEKMV